MDISAYENLVTGYYLFENMPDNVGDNWSRYICTDGEHCREVEYDYQPKEDELVFYCTITRGNSRVELYKKGGEVKK